MAVITTLEKLNKDLATALGKEHSAVLDAQVQLGAPKGKIFGKSTERELPRPGCLTDYPLSVAESTGHTSR